MPLTPNFARTKAPILFVLVATIICSALSASPLFRASRAAARASGESVQVYAGDCVTPQTTFNLGDTVCVRAGELPLPPDAAEYYRRINYSAPDLGVVESTTVRSDPQFDRFRIPSSGDSAQPGTWRVQTVDIDTNAQADARFIVRHPLIRITDLHVWKQGPESVFAGDKIRYTLAVRNDGPEDAEAVQLIEEVPTNATFLSLRQTSGARFECQTPGQHETGRIICTSNGLKLGDRATFDVYYVVNEFAREGDACAGTTLAVSRTEERHKFDNETRYSALVGNPEEQGPPPDPEP